VDRRGKSFPSKEPLQIFLFRINHAIRTRLNFKLCVFRVSVSTAYVILCSSQNEISAREFV